MKRIQAALARALGLRMDAQEHDHTRSCTGISSRLGWTWPQYHDL